MNWLIISNMKIRPPSPAKVLTTAAITSLGVLAHRAAESDAGDEEAEHDDEEQAGHEGRLADDGAGDGIAQRRARRQGDQQHKAQHGQKGDARPAQALGLQRGIDLVGRGGLRGIARLRGSYLPRRGSMIRTTTRPTTTVIRMAETAWKK